jgi:hypothetical protein
MHELEVENSMTWFRFCCFGWIYIAFLQMGSCRAGVFLKIDIENTDR